MTLLRQKLAARLLLGLGVALGLAWLVRLDYAQRISTDVLDLIPTHERAPELAMLRTLAGERQARVALFAVEVPEQAGENAANRAKRREQTAAAFADTLSRSPAFAEVARMGDTSARDALGAHLFQNRFDLLLPGWLAARTREYAVVGTGEPWDRWLAERAASDLEAFLAKPEALAFQTLLPADPLLLVPGFVEQTRSFADAAPGQNQSSAALIWARTAAPPLREEGQQPVFAAVEQARAAACAYTAGTTVRWTAISRFAAESRRRIEREMSGLNLFSLAAVLTVAAISVRRVFKALHLAPVILCSLLGAWVATTLLFERVHVLVFVVGALLGGVAVDYGFYLYMQPPLWPGEPYWDKVARLIKPLLASALTTAIGFAVLALSELPLIRQLGVFVSAGLLCALATALLWFAQVDSTYLESRDWVCVRSSGNGRWRRWLLALGAAVAIFGPWRLHWHDDIHELDIPAPELWANDLALRTQFGETPGRAIYLTHGATPAEARTGLERFLAWHSQAFPGAAAASLGLALPTKEQWEATPARSDALSGFVPELRAALTRHDFDPDGFAAFFDAWNAWRERRSRPAYDALMHDLAGKLRGPLALLLSTEAGSCWFATVTDHPPGADAPTETATLGTAQLETLNRLFGRYRISALWLSSLGLGLVGLSVFAIYGLRRGARIFAVPAGSCLFAFGVFGLVGQTMNLFHLLGVFLGVCLSHNYAIFSCENAARGESPPPSIRLSALTTAVSFGVLAMSQIPVVSALGAMVSLIVLTALAIVELAPFAQQTDRNF